MFVQFVGQTLILNKIVRIKAFLAKPGFKIVYPNEKNLYLVPNHKKNRDYYNNPHLIHLMDELWLLGKLREKEHLMQNQSINIVYPKRENVFMIPNHEKKRDY